MPKLAKKSRALKNFKTYVYTSRTPLYGCILVFPLLTVYEILVLKLKQTQMREIRNGADVMLRNLLEYLGVNAMFTCSAILLGGILIFIIYLGLKNKKRLQFRYFGYMIIESAILALLFGLVMGKISSLFTLSVNQGSTLGTRVLLSIGAGIYEEFVFRVLILSGLIIIFIRIFHVKPATAILNATILSSCSFAIFHYIGPGKDLFNVHSFLFRLLAGLVFGVLYVLRGFGVAAYIHTFYDLYLDLYITAG